MFGYITVKCCDTLKSTAGGSAYCDDPSAGSFCLIDFNDWPSFSRCREQAADAITGLVKSE